MTETISSIEDPLVSNFEFKTLDQDIFSIEPENA